MKDFCSIAVTHNHDDHQQNTGHCLKANSKRPPLSSKLPAIITQPCATVHRNAKSSGKMEIHKTLMKDLQYEEARDDIGWCKTVKVVVEVFLIIIITTCLAESFVTSYRRPLKLRSYYLGLPTWNWIVLIMEIVCGLSIIRFITFVVILLIKKHQTLRPGKYVLFFATELKMRSAVTVWFGLVFLTWLFWLRPRIKLTSDDAHEAVHYITTSLLCLLLGSISLLLKDMLCLRLEADLHFYQFFGRIRDTILDLHGIRIIHEKEKWKFLKYKKKNLWMEVHQMEQKTIPIWILKRLVELYIRDIENKPLGEIDNHATKDDQELLEGAQKMFESIVRSSNGEHPDYISRENLQKTYFKDNEDELNYLFKVLKKRKRPDGEPTQKEANTSQLPWEKEITGEQKEEEQIDRAQFLSWAVLAYKKCWGLQRTLHSSEVGFIKLNKLLSSFLILIMIAVWLLATNILSTSKLALLFSPLLASTFVFGHACKNMFEGLIFAFGMHPFDVGDRVVIDGMQMKVRKMNFLTTLFFKYNTQEEVIYPNSILAGKSICNLDIAPDQSDSLDFAIDAETPLEDIVDIENRIKKHLQDDLHYCTKSQVVKKEFQLGEGKEIKMTVYFKYLVSYLDNETRAVRKSNILTFIIKLQKENEKNIIKHASEPDDILGFHITVATSLKKIQELDAKLMSYLKGNEEYGIYVEEEGNTHKRYSKVLIEELGKKEIKMSLHLKNPLKCTPKKHQHKMDIEKKIEEFKQEMGLVLPQVEAAALKEATPEIAALGILD